MASTEPLFKRFAASLWYCAGELRFGRDEAFCVLPCNGGGRGGHTDSFMDSAGQSTSAEIFLVAPKSSVFMIFFHYKSFVRAENVSVPHKVVDGGGLFIDERPSEYLTPSPSVPSLR